MENFYPYRRFISSSCFPVFAFWIELVVVIFDSSCSRLGQNYYEKHSFWQVVIRYAAAAGIIFLGFKLLGINSQAVITSGNICILGKMVLSLCNCQKYFLS